MNTKKLLTLLCALALTSLFFVSCSDFFKQDADETDNIDKTLYSITYDANGAETGTAPAGVWNTETTVVTLAENTGKLARAGYAFAGWNTDKNGKGYSYAAASKMSMPGANITLYARWTALSYIVTWDSREADYPALPGKTTVSGPATTVLEFPIDPIKNGLSFAGWWTEPDGKGGRFTSDSVVSADITVYAKWTENAVHTVSFDSKGGSEVASLIIEENHHAAEPKPPVKPGYAFGGWYADAGYSTQWDFVSMKIATNVTLTAKWNAYAYTISFDSQYATVAASPEAVIVTSPQATMSALPSAPVKTGYTFGGWHTEANGEGRQFTEDTAVSGDATVYAKWIPLRYTIKFDSVGADKTANPSSVMISYPQTSLNTLPIPPEKSGFLFGGWWTEENGQGSEITKNSTFANDATVYAYWKYLDRQVSFYHTYTNDTQNLHRRVTIEHPDITVADMPDIPEKTGFDFGGWWTEVDGQGTEFTENTEVFEDIKVYAKWIKKPYALANNPDGTVTLESFTTSDPNVVIPATIDGKTVTAIGGQAFSENTTMKTLVLPDTVTTIGEGAFFKCEALTSVTLPDSLETISDVAFGFCLNLESIEIPNSVESIGEHAFWACVNMTSVTLPDTLTEIKKAVFSNCEKLSSIVLPATVLKIGYQAFYNCKSLVAIDLPPNATSIGEEAFFLCINLAEIAIPNKMTSISNKTFSNCPGLTTVELPDTITAIGDEAFLGCKKLSEIIVNSVEPPTLGILSFTDMPSGYAIKVPAGSLTAYQTSDYWKTYNITSQ